VSDTRIMALTGAACFDCRGTTINSSTVPCYPTRESPGNHPLG